MNDVRQEEKRREDLLPLMQRAFDLCLSLYGHVNRFPRAYKPLLVRDWPNMPMPLNYPVRFFLNTMCRILARD
jgi:hypothetical protein